MKKTDLIPGDIVVVQQGVHKGKGAQVRQVSTGDKNTVHLMIGGKLIWMDAEKVAKKHG